MVRRVLGAVGALAVAGTDSNVVRRVLVPACADTWDAVVLRPLLDEVPDAGGLAGGDAAVLRREAGALAAADWAAVVRLLAARLVVMCRDGGREPVAPVLDGSREVSVRVLRVLRVASRVEEGGDIAGMWAAAPSSARCTTLGLLAPW